VDTRLLKINKYYYISDLFILNLIFKGMFRFEIESRRIPSLYLYYLPSLYLLLWIFDIFFFGLLHFNDWYLLQCLYLYTCKVLLWAYVLLLVNYALVFDIE
jgi:hypothetical protein